MNDNEKNSVMNVDDYENMAVQKSNNAKRVAAGAALFVGGAAVAGGSAYAATADDDHDLIDDTTLTTDDVVGGGNVANDYQPQVHHQTTERVIYQDHEVYEEHEVIEKPEMTEKPEVEQSEEPQVTWDEKTVIYDGNGNVVASAESGTIDGNKFTLLDGDGDEIADYFAYDQNGNGEYEENEVVVLDKSDGMMMGHETAHTREIHQETQDIVGGDELAQNDDQEIIHNNFEDEKTGETYHGDYAENNEDYNPGADMTDYGNSNDYLAENDEYSDDSYGIGAEYIAEDNTYSIDEDETQDDLAFEAEDMDDDDDATDTSEYYAENDSEDSFGDLGGEEDLLV